MALIDEHRERFGVEPICRVLTEHGCKIAPNSYWAHKKRPPSKRAVRGAGLMVEIRRIYVDNLFVYGADAVRDAITATITTLPAELRRSLTWDRGKDMARHADIKIATGLGVYFCDPHSPWQRGTTENTNGLLRQYFPKGTDLSRHSAEDLAAIAHALNTRLRKTLGWKTPAEALNDLLLSGQQGGVASTG